MAYEIGSAPITLLTIEGTDVNIHDLTKCNTCPDNGNINDTAYDNKVVILSFIDYNNGMDWLTNLKNLYDNTNSNDVKIIAIVFQYNSAPDLINVATDARVTAISNSYPVFLDQSWLLSNPSNNIQSFARAYSQGFTTDALFNNSYGQTAWTYILTKDHLISDKWNTNCTSNSDPISFLQLGQYKAVLGVADYTVGDTLDISLNADMIVPNLTGTNSIVINAAGNVTVTLDDPRVQSIIPAGGTITSLSAIVITFSEHVPNAGNSGYYTMTLTGVSVTPSYQNRSTLDTTLTGNTEDYLTERIINLCNDPAILRYTPVAGRKFSGGIDQPVSIAFSKPISAPTEANCSMGGTGFNALTDTVDTDGNGITDGTFTYDSVEDLIELTLYGEVASGADEDPIDITLTGITDTGGNPLAGQSVIEYKADTTSPKIISVIKNPHLNK